MQISSHLVPEFKLNPYITTKDFTRCCKDAFEVNEKKTPMEKISMTFEYAADIILLIKNTTCK